MKRASLSSAASFTKYSAGIDVSKETFNCCLTVIDTEQQVKIIGTRQFSNTLKGFVAFDRWIQKKSSKHDIPVAYTLEATGVYYEQLAWYLHDLKFHVSVILPNKAKNYLKSIGLKSKTDRIDALGLATMGAQQRLERWTAPDTKLLELRSITRQRESLQNMKTMVSNQLEAVTFAQHSSSLALNQLQQHLKLLEEQIEQTEVLIEELVNQDRELKAKFDNILPIKGLGLVSLATVVAETNGFQLFNNQRQLTSYAGYDVIESQSGNHRGNTKISKKGNSHIRRILHMPSLCVVTSNEPVFRSLYERVYERTKVKMKGYVAVQRKLLCIIYALWKNDTPYQRHIATMDVSNIQQA